MKGTDIKRIIWCCTDPWSCENLYSVCSPPSHNITLNINPLTVQEYLAEGRGSSSPFHQAEADLGCRREGGLYFLYIQRFSNWDVGWFSLLFPQEQRFRRATGFSPQRLLTYFSLFFFISSFFLLCEVSLPFYFWLWSFTFTCFHVSYQLTTCILLLLTTHLHNTFSIFPDSSSFCSTLFPLILFLSLCVFFFLGETNVQMSKMQLRHKGLKNLREKWPSQSLPLLCLDTFGQLYWLMSQIRGYLSFLLILLCESRRV